MALGTDPVTPSIGWGVLHLFFRVTAAADPETVISAVKDARQGGDQVVTVALLGHKADVGIMALGPDLHRLRSLQTALRRCGLELAGSYVSLTELSEYAEGLPEEMRQARLYPQLPPPDKPAFCFYPMSKRRGPEHNWYTLSFEQRQALMHGHGAAARHFKGRILQLVTGSTGLDDYEWGVTLFGEHPDDLKDCVHRMRFDEASALYAEFGPFWTGMVGEVEDVLAGVLGG
jgi:hydrogen peroxide-dependent heme synthase